MSMIILTMHLPLILGEFQNLLPVSETISGKQVSSCRPSWAKARAEHIRLFQQCLWDSFTNVKIGSTSFDQLLSWLFVIWTLTGARFLYDSLVT